MADADADDPPRPAARPTWADVLSPLLGAAGRRGAALAAVALLVVGAGVAGYALVRTPPAPPTEQLLPYAPGAGGPAAPGPGASTSSTMAPGLVVHAAGAVAVPGVHRLPAGSRVEDLLAVAGGPAADADLDRVNLAAPVTDGQRVWIPRVGEATPPAVATGSPAATGTEAGGEPDGPIDLNTATAEQLDTLPGVGPATAAAIIEHRERHGPFRAVDDLLDVPGIGDAKLAQLRDLVTV
jgi:competence protein ComEA